VSATGSRVNRTLLTLLGVLLAVGAGLGLALSFGAFGTGRASRPVLDPEISQFASDNAGWFWPVVAAITVLLGLLALKWLTAQLSGDKVGELDLERDRSRGSTRVSSRAVTDAVTAELEGQRGVQGACAKFRGDSREPDLDLTVSVDDSADLGTVRQRIESTTVQHARQALGRPDMRVRLHVELVPRQRPALH
jgi:hypothetical protein